MRLGHGFKNTVVFLFCFLSHVATTRPGPGLRNGDTGCAATSAVAVLGMELGRLLKQHAWFQVFVNSFLEQIDVRRWLRNDRA